MKLILLISFCLLFCTFSFGQKRGAVWCFGDSALVDFSDPANIITGTSILKSRGSCASISDTSGNLLFYAGYDNDVYINGGGAFINGEIISHNHTTMTNGDSINLQLWYREVVIVDKPATSNQYYVFSIEVTSNNPQGLFYSIVDMSLNGGLGEVIQKNVQLENFKAVDCLSAVKHGNGRDWWVIYRRWNNSPSAPNNEWYECLVTPSGIFQQPILTVGSIQSSGFGNISFNKLGTRLAYINYPGLVELYDFDRCTGLISNPVNISLESPQAPWPENWSAEFSPSGELMYVSQISAFPPDSCYLIQFDLNATNISLSADTIWKTPYFENMGQLKLAPDGKIYLTTNFGGGYPYSDSTYNYINMNLSVINSPDSIGSACDLQPFSFYLGGKRSYFGWLNACPELMCWCAESYSRISKLANLFII
jgi:hypothetical protein